MTGAGRARRPSPRRPPPMARLPYVDPASAPEEVRATFERLPISLNVFRMMAHATTNFRPLVGLGTAILGRQQLDPDLSKMGLLINAGRPDVRDIELRRDIDLD